MRNNFEHVIFYEEVMHDLALLVGRQHPSLPLLIRILTNLAEIFVFLFVFIYLSFFLLYFIQLYFVYTCIGS